jgi:hypothetical protein
MRLPTQILEAPQIKTRRKSCASSWPPKIRPFKPPSTFLSAGATCHRKPPIPNRQSMRAATSLELTDTEPPTNISGCAGSASVAPWTDREEWYVKLLFRRRVSADACGRPERQAVTRDSVNAFGDLMNARGGRGVRDSPARSSPLSGVADMHDGQRPAARRAGAHQITVTRPIVYLKACPQRLADGTKDHDTCHWVRPRLAFVRCATLSRYVKYARDHANG